MLMIDSIVNDFKIDRELLVEYLCNEKIDILIDNSIPQKYQDTILSFIENQESRIDKALSQHNSAFISSDDRVKIYKDDAISFLKKIPSNSVDLIVTDPAYSGLNNKLQLGKGRIVGKYAEKGKEDAKWFDEFKDSEENYSLFLTECQRVLKKSTGHIYIMFDSFSLLTLGGIVRDFFDVKNIITWDKVNIGMGHYFRRRHEYIVFATNGNSRKIRNRRFPDVWRFKRIHNAKYPTQKPVEVFQAMIYASSEKDFVVCDPFTGSASSAIAAMKNNCKFIGCDISEKSIEISRSRVEHYIKNGIDILQPKSSSADENVFWE
ncbi:MAG: DNA-methyltransferase [Campylobacterales bacterium]